MIKVAAANIQNEVGLLLLERLKRGSHRKAYWSSQVARWRTVPFSSHAPYLGRQAEVRCIFVVEHSYREDY
jgi:hypothetical protein